MIPERHGVCSRCHEGTVFTLDPETGEWLSMCCSALDVPEDVASWMEDR